MKMESFKEFINKKTPNKVSNFTQEGINEDPRLVKIRQFKGSIEDFKAYWYDKIKNQNA